MSLQTILSTAGQRPDSTAAFDGRELVLNRPLSWSGRLFNALSRIFTNTVRENNGRAVDAYLHELSKVDPDLASVARRSLIDTSVGGNSLTLRTIRQLGGRELFGTICTKEAQFRANLGDVFSDPSIQPNEAQIKDAESLIRALELVKAHLGPDGPPDALAEIDRRVGALRDFAARSIDESRPFPSNNGRSALPSVFSNDGVLQVYNSRGHTLVSTGLTRKQVDELKSSVDPQGRLKPGISTEKAAQLRQRALGLVESAGEQQLLGFLKDAPTEALLDLGGQIARGDYWELSQLHDLHREEFTAHVLSAKELSVLGRHRSDLSGGISTVSEAEPTIAPTASPTTPIDPLVALNLKPSPGAPSSRSLLSALIAQSPELGREPALLQDVRNEIGRYQYRAELPQGIEFYVPVERAPGPHSNWDLFHCPYVARVINRPILVTTNYGATVFSPGEKPRAVSESSQIPAGAILLSYSPTGTWSPLTADGASNTTAVKAPANQEAGAPAVSFSEIRDIRDFLAELIFPENPENAESPDQGERLRGVLLSRPDLIVRIIRNPEILETAGIPGDLSTPLKQLSDAIETTPGAAGILKELPAEQQTEILSQALSEAPREVFDDLAASLDREIVNIDFNQLPGGEGLASIGSDGGSEESQSNIQKFLSRVFGGYFNAQTLSDRKTLIATYFRESKPGDTGNRQLVSLLKGSGPYLQKFLQLFGDAVPDAELREELATVKSDLKSIPRTVRDAYLASIVRESGGAIESIEVIRSLGAASVGETYLVKVTKTGGEPEQAVVKLLRPGLQLRGAREKEFLEGVARDIPGIPETLDGITKQIDAEMDLSHEAENIRAGQVYTEAGYEGVEAMRLVEGAPVLPNAIMIEKAPGMTVKRYIDTLRSIREGGRVPAGWDVHDVGAKLSSRLGSLSELWLEQAMLGDGYYHGDLHSGNIIFDHASELPDGDGLLTVIDFGNAKTLSKEERRAVARIILAIETNNTDQFVESFTSVLSPVSLARLDGATMTEFKSKAREIISKPGDSSGKKVESLLQAAAESGLEIPATLSNFSRSQLMLETAINDLNQVRKDLYDIAVVSDVLPRTWNSSLLSLLRNEVPRRDMPPDKFAFLTSILDVPFENLSQDQKDRARQLMGEAEFDRIVVADAKNSIYIPSEQRPEKIPVTSSFGDCMSNVTNRHLKDFAFLVGIGRSLKIFLAEKFGLNRENPSTEVSLQDVARMAEESAVISSVPPEANALRV